jgi:magnesium chelatase family protein
MRKGGPAYDLPIAVAMLLATQHLMTTQTKTAFLGELGFDGTLRSTDGMLPMVIAAREAGMTHVVVPQAAAAEAALVQGIRIVPCTTLRMVAEYLEGSVRIPAPQPLPTPDESSEMVDFADVRGNQHARRALEVVASGGHNILLTGAPGSGKTIMARALWGILPLLTADETLEVAKIRSVAGMLGRDGFMSRMRPFCAPHHTTSLAGLVGGGANRIKPGMATLAHRGVLFLDELPEYGSKLEVLRQPLEDRSITISRAHGSVLMPANSKVLMPCWRNRLSSSLS